MLRRRREDKTAATRRVPAFDDFHEWVLSLPWVVERPYKVGTAGVRSFGVDCELLGRRQLWLLTGLQRQLEVDGFGIAVIVPEAAASEIEAGSWGRSIAPMRAGHVMVTVYGDLADRRHDVEALVLSAYEHAMS